MDYILQEHFKTVEETTGEKDNEFFEIVADVIKTESSKISQTKIRGIIVGTANCSIRRASTLYIEEYIVYTSFNRQYIRAISDRIGTWETWEDEIFKVSNGQNHKRFFIHYHYI
jgi:hypothetical protein